MKRFVLLASITTTFSCGLAAALVACGGATEEAGVAAPEADSGGSTSSSSTSGGGSSTSSSTSSGGSTSSSGGANDGGGPTDGGTTTDGGGTSSGTPNQITCGTATCTAGQKCCTTFQQGVGVVSACIPSATECQGASQSCDDKADCPAGQICCAGGGGGGGPGSGFGASCQTTCQGIQMCKAPTECTDGGTCQTYTCFNRSVSLCRKPQFGCN